MICLLQISRVQRLRGPQWCERHGWRGSAISPPTYTSLGSTRWPHRRPLRENISQTKEPTAGHNRDQGCDCAGKRASTKGLRHTWTVCDTVATGRHPHCEESLGGSKCNPLVQATWKKKPHPCRLWWFYSTRFCKWPHSSHWQPVWAEWSQHQ